MTDQRVSSPFPDPVIEPELVRVCIECKKEKPLTAFCRQSSGGATLYLHTCASCAGGFDQRKRRALTTKRVEALKVLVAGLRGRKLRAPHVSELCDAMMAQFGGVEGFALFWKEQIDAAAQEKPGSKVVADHLKALSNLVAVSTEHRQSAPDVADMSLEEIEQELMETMRNVIPIDFVDPDEPNEERPATD